MTENSYMVAVNSGNSIPYSPTVVYEGKTIAGQQLMVDNNIRIGDNPDFTWIPGGLGDQRVLPYVPYEPNPMEIPVWPTQVVVTSGYFAPFQKWTVDLTSDDITMSCDMPGVKVDALKVEIKDGWLSATGVRHDLKNAGNQRFASTTYNQYDVSKYDPESAVATLLDGVLTISLKKREEFKPRVVKVRVSK